MRKRHVGHMDRLIATSIDTSVALLKAGVNPRSADMKWTVKDGEWELVALHHDYNVQSESHKNKRTYPAWTWEALFRLMPTVITIDGRHARLQVVRNGTEITEHRYVDTETGTALKTIGQPRPNESAALMVEWLYKRGDDEE